ncbi:MAG: hypothetical protein ACT4N2_12515, partial [Hyphomicrobium sp.]
PRRAVWTAVGSLLLVVAFILTVMIAFWSFEPIYGAIPTAAALAALCAAAGFLGLMVPPFVEWRRRRKAAAAAESPVTQVAAVVQEETEAAVDYFGAAQVVASAFMFGLGAARQLRQR